MRKLMSSLLIATAPLSLAACNKSAEEAPPITTEEVPVETPMLEDSDSTTDATAPADAMAAEDGK